MASSVTAWITRQRVPAAEIFISEPAREARWALAYALFYIGASLATGLVIRAGPHPILSAAGFTQDAVYVVAFKLVLLLAVPLAWFLHRGYRLSHVLAGWRATPGAILRVALAFIIGASINASHVAWLQVAVPKYTGTDLALRIGLALLLPLVSAGLPEEFYYRAVLQTRIERQWGRWAAVLSSTVLFTAWHLPTRILLAHGVEGQAGQWGSVLLGTGLPVFIVGLFFCWQWDRNRNLPLLVALHWGIDLLPAASSLFGVRV
jgi:uncharacterized protein